MEAVVRWNHIPSDKIHGILTGYLFTYGLSKVGKNAQEFPDMTSVTVRLFHENLLNNLFKIVYDVKQIVCAYTEAMFDF